METTPANGTIRLIEGVRRAYYDGYWIKVYDPPADSLQTKKELIRALTRRLFNHVEHGINIPGKRLDEARRAYVAETDLQHKRVKGAMLAGALFNRATDIFTKLVELQELGVVVDADNALMNECGACLEEALQLGKLVRHSSGEEGIDELWGEPFRAFSIPVEAFYESRLIKIAQVMRDIDRITTALRTLCATLPAFSGIDEVLSRFASAARLKCETLRTDDDIFQVWPDFAVAADGLTHFQPRPESLTSVDEQRLMKAVSNLLLQGRELITYITRARVSMPKSSADFIERCTNLALDIEQWKLEAGRLPA